MRESIFLAGSSLVALFFACAIAVILYEPSGAFYAAATLEKWAAWVVLQLRAHGEGRKAAIKAYREAASRVRAEGWAR